MLGRKWTLIALSPHSQTAVSLIRILGKCAVVRRDTPEGTKLIHTNHLRKGISYRGRRISVHAMSAPPHPTVGKFPLDNSVWQLNSPPRMNLFRKCLSFVLIVLPVFSHQLPSIPSIFLSDEKRQRTRRINVEKLNKQLDYINQFITFLGGFGLDRERKRKSVAGFRLSDIIISLVVLLFV